MSDSIHQEVKINATAERIFSALTDAAQFSSLTGGAPAEIDTIEGKSFSLFGGKVLGRNVEIVPNQRIVQAWRTADWGEGVFSIVKFELSKAGANTLLIFDQSGFPPDAKPHLETGWHKMYWEPLKQHLA